MKKKISLLGVAAVTIVLAPPHKDTRVAISGAVTFRGTIPEPTLIDMRADAYCAGVQATAQNKTSPIATGAMNGLQGAVVYVKSGLTGSGGGADLEPAVLDQKNCMYNPGLVAVQTNQPIRIRNSDATLHNVHAYATENRGFNIGQPFQGIESRRVFGTAEVGIEVKCDVHGWMSGSIAVFDHGFFSMTDDNGRFSIEDLPPGDYTIEAWHPVLGAETQSVTITAGTTPTLQFEFAS